MGKGYYCLSQIPLGEGKGMTLGAIIPVYNVEKYLRECIDSVINQKTKFDEIVLIDDGSEDDSGKICDYYADKYDCFKVVHQSNLGLSISRNKGISIIETDYVVFLDSDDYITYDYVDILKDKINKFNQIDVVFFSANIKCDDGKERENIYIRMPNICDRHMTGIDLCRNIINHNWIVSACLGAYSRSFLYSNDIFFMENMIYEDNLFSVKVLDKAENVLAIGERIYIRRYRDNSITNSTYTEENYASHSKVIGYVTNYICKESNFNNDRLLSLCIISKYMRVLLHYTKFVNQEVFFKHGVNIFKDIISVLCDRNYCESLNISLEIDLLIGLNRIKYVDETYFEFLNDKTRDFKSKLKKKLSKCLLADASKTVAIYGIGENASSFLNLYEKIIGAALADYFFIVSDLSYMDRTFRGRKVYSIDMLPDYVDQIVITSLKYKDDMMKKINSFCIPCCKQYSLYDLYDYYDCCKILKYVNEFDAI